MLPDHQCTLLSRITVLLNRGAEGFDSEANAEFIRFLRYAKRSCTEVQSELYVALDEEYISPNEFKDVYEQASMNREPSTLNLEPDNLSSYVLVSETYTNKLTK